MLEELESLANHFFYSPCPVPACTVIPSHNFIEVRAESCHFPSYSCQQDQEFNILLQLAILLLLFRDYRKTFYARKNKIVRSVEG